MPKIGLPKKESLTVEFKTSFNDDVIEAFVAIHDLLSGNYVSKSCNKLIAKAFKETGIIERYGSVFRTGKFIIRPPGIAFNSFIF